MAEKYEVEVFITEEGNVSMRVKGIRGKSCVDKLKALASPLGKFEDVEYTSEYYEQEQKVKQISKQKT
ncbi:MAG: DUF2997 domain-containing protein [Candidatus Omnitrophica bacterium]|nr:DUF2997 domain-containing protein [Candidatus Omnitrophota bacterium]